jgi:hypothetical protein
MFDAKKIYFFSANFLFFIDYIYTNVIGLIILNKTSNQLEKCVTIFFLQKKLQIYERKKSYKNMKEKKSYKNMKEKKATKI